jgi:hypothetical protein
VNDAVESTPSGELSIAERVTKPVVYRLPGMDRVRVIPNLKYSEVDNPHLLMDVYISTAGVRNSPKTTAHHPTWCSSKLLLASREPKLTGGG